MTTEDFQAWSRFARPDQIIVDLHSPRLFDMTYIHASDIYLGDMSSQLYEFLVHPRPVAFINAHKAVWQHDPRYAGWHLGEVADSVDEVFEAIDRAVAGHPAKAAQQEEAVRISFGSYRGASARGAHIIAEAIQAAA